MESNRIAKLLGVLVLLFGIAYLSGAFEQAPSTLDLPSVRFDTEGITRIEVNSPRYTVITEKEDSKWRMTQPVNWPADSNAISSFFSQLAELKLKSVVSISPDRYERYGVDSSAFFIKMTDARGEHEIVMSPNGPEYSSVYVRVGGDERVFLASPRLSIPFNPTQWRDKGFLSLEPNLVIAATVSTPDESYTVSRESPANGWVIQQTGSSSPSDSVAVARWFSRFAALKVDGFIDEDSEYAEPTHFIEFRLVDGTTYRLDATREEARFVFTKGPADDTVYYFNTSRAEPLFPSSESLSASE